MYLLIFLFSSLFVSMYLLIFLYSCTCFLGFCFHDQFSSLRSVIGIEALLLKTQAELARIEKLGLTIRRSASAWLQVKMLNDDEVFIMNYEDP